ncbi:MAG: hypothetical protein ACK5Q5_23045 [Planctomycetaceae bacterium]
MPSPFRTIVRLLMLVVTCCWGTVGTVANSMLRADDEGQIQITFMRDRMIFVQLKERVIVDGNRQARQSFFEVVNEGEASLSEPIVARWTTGWNSFDIARREAAARLSQLVTTVQSQTPLTDAQLSKLRLAGSGDISRYIAECQQVWEEHRKHPVAWQTVQELSPRCIALRDHFTSGLHGSDSLLRKLLAKMLSESELDRVSALLDNRPAQSFEIRPL